MNKGVLPVSGLPNAVSSVKFSRHIHFQISDFSFFIFELISEVAVLLVLLHQLLYGL
jgi:hypothetical protein